MIIKRSAEFQIIDEFFERQASQHQPASVIVGIGDDCAVLAPNANAEQVISVDTSIAGRHFPEDAAAYDIAYRSLNVALSDLAAMGAKPCWFTLALSLNHHDKNWLQDFSKGLFEAASHANIALIGGDTTKVPENAPLSITVQVHGEVPFGKALLRQGAKVGDKLYVSNCLGDAAAGLLCYQQGLHYPDLLRAYLRPEPQITLGLHLQDHAHSCIDISDGLLADLGHILQRSGIGAEIDLQSIPLSESLLSYCDRKKALGLALSGGDDYQLLFSSDQVISMDNVTVIGRIIDKTGIHLLNDDDNISQTLSMTGFDHFYEPSV